MTKTAVHDITLAEALTQRRSGRDYLERPVPLDSVRRLHWAAQGVTGETGNRTAPSAHALHPLRLLLVAGNIAGLDHGVYSVSDDAETLTPRTTRDLRGALEEAALEDQPWIGKAAGIITICADFVAPCRDFADQPPLGARGARYIYIEAGAAAQNIQLQAATEGLGSVLVAGFRDEATAEVLHLKAPVAPVLHLCFGWPAPG